MALISLNEYAKRNGKSGGVARQRALRGAFRTAQKIGYMWVIDEDEEWVDHRVTDGSHVDWRKRYPNRTKE